MKKITLIFICSILLACSNNESTNLNNELLDSTAIERDNTTNRDTGINRIDTTLRRDSI